MASTQKTAREKSLVESIFRFLNQQPLCRARKTHGNAYSAGQPDIVGCYRGRYVAIECKKVGGKPSALQGRDIDEIVKCGGLAVSVKSKKEFMDWWDNRVGFNMTWI